MSGKSVLDSLKQLCRDLDSGVTPLRLRRAAVVVAVPAMVLSPACMMYGAPDYGVPFEEYDCSDGIDNDGDGFTDCYDEDCPTTELCMSCFDAVDNDMDGAADCSDTECAATEACLGTCSDGEDGDGDGLIDCEDPDCGPSPEC